MRFDCLRKFTLREVESSNRGVDFLSRNNLRYFLNGLSKELLRVGVGNKSKQAIACLEIRARNQEATTCSYPIRGDEVLIGRAKDCSIILTDRRVSLHHAKIIYVNGLYKMVDLGSANGTSLNGTAINPMRAVALQSRDIIKIGDFEILFCCSIREATEYPLHFGCRLINNNKEEILFSIKNYFYMISRFRSSLCEANILIFMPAYMIHRLSYKVLGIEKRLSVLNSIGCIEQSVIDYLMMRLSLFSNKNGIPVSFLSSIYSGDRVNWEAIIRDYFIIEVTTEIDKELCCFYLALPNEINKRERCELDKKMGIMGCNVEVIIVLGYSMVRISQLKEIEVSDIVILDKSYINFSEGTISGKAVMLSNIDRWSGIWCNLIKHKNKQFLELITFIDGGVMEEFNLNKSEEASDKVATDELGKDFIETVEALIVVELCRMKLPLMEIMEWRKGKLVQLNKNLSTEVNLSVDNKIIANGRLVQIEGKLGVQIDKLNKILR